MLQSSVAEKLGELLIGQDPAIQKIAPYVEQAISGLSPVDRPAAVFLLVGPTGVGKTHAVHSLAKVLHGQSARVLRIDCGEYQMDHEVAKLIGAPPGYLGHRETHPALSQQKVKSVSSEGCGASIVLFDEIEKAAPSFHRILLGILDRGTLRLGDSTSVDFSTSLIFMTSNVGSAEIASYSAGGFGFASAAKTSGRAGKIAVGALNRQFSPEFLNRVDEVIPFDYLDGNSIAKILDIEVKILEDFLKAKLGIAALQLTVEVKAHLIECGTSRLCGARELKRLIQREVMQRVVRIAGLVKINDVLFADIIRGEVTITVDAASKVLAASEGGEQ